VTTDRVIVDKKLKVFISYSRNDMAFALRVVAALEVRGLSPKMDTRDLPKLEDWRRELLGFIREADAIVLIVSPTSVSSPICSWEIEQAVNLNKRIAPIVLERVADDHVPEAVGKINYLFFDQPEDFESQADALAQALQTDLSWLKEHTRLGELARRWAGRKRAARLLLRGKEVHDAERWIAARPPRAPEPTELHREYISQSRRAATLRAVWAAGIVVATVVVGVAGWEGEAWLTVQHHLSLQLYEDYLGRTLPLHFFKETAKQRESEYYGLRNITEGDPEQYGLFAQTHAMAPLALWPR
jgi:hypothetical protein